MLKTYGGTVIWDLYTATHYNLPIFLLCLLNLPRFLLGNISGQMLLNTEAYCAKPISIPPETI